MEKQHFDFTYNGQTKLSECGNYRDFDNFVVISSAREAMYFIRCSLENEDFGTSFCATITHTTKTHNQNLISTNLTIDVDKHEDGLFEIKMATAEGQLFSNSTFKTRSPVGLVTYIQGNISTWLAAFKAQVEKVLVTENENIRIKLEAEAAERAKRRV